MTPSLRSRENRSSSPALFRCCAALIALATVWLFAANARAQSPELSIREFASGQIKKGVRSIGVGGDGATWGNYGLVYRDADAALLDAGVTAYTNGNRFTFTSVGATTPPLWHGLAIYAIALSQHAEGLHLSLASPALGAPARPVQASGANQAVFTKIATPLGDAAAATVHYATRWRPSGGLGVAWQPLPRLLFGARTILNHDEEVRTDDAGTTQGLARSYECRLGAAASPWTGAILDVGGTELYKRNGLTGATTSALHPNLGLEQAMANGAYELRAGLDETSYAGGLTARWRPLRLDLAYVYDLGRARVGSLFGKTSNSVLATQTIDFGWRSSAAGQSAPAPAPRP